MQMGEVTFSFQHLFLFPPFQLEVTSAGENGTLLQDAIIEDKQDFVLLLLEHGLVAVVIDNLLYHLLC